MKVILIMLILCPFLLPIFISSKISDSKSKHYVVLESGEKNLSKQTQKALYNAISKGYGKQPMQVRTMKERKAIYLQWELPEADGSSSFTSLKLTQVSGGLGFPLDGPVGLTNCVPTEDCSCCKTDCSCSKSQGSQKDCGDSKCEERTVENILPEGMTESLAG